MNKETLLKASAIHSQIVTLENEKGSLLKVLEKKNKQFIVDVTKYDGWGYTRKVVLTQRLGEKIIIAMINEIDSELKDLNEQFEKV